MGISNQIPNSRISQAGVVPNEAARPAAPYDGQVIYQQDTDRTLVWNGVAWVDVSTGKAGKPGLVLVKEQTIGSAVSSVTVNDAFSNTFDCYKIIISGGVASTDLFFGMSLGASDTSYYQGRFGLTYANGAGSNGVDNDAKRWTVAGSGNTSTLYMDLEINNPAAAKHTQIMGGYFSSTGAVSIFGEHKVATAYTDFTLTTSTGNVTGGTVRVYGYNQ